MNFPPAPQSIKARASTFLFVSSHTCTGMENELNCIFSVVMQYISSMGEIDVETILLFKNPLFFLSHPVPSASGQSHFECEPRVPSDSSFSVG